MGKLWKAGLLLAAATTTLAACGDTGGAGGGTRSVHVVGSSTLYPFATAIAEELTRSNPQAQSPRIESTGTGGGIKLFCAGVGADKPDIVNASRRLKQNELADCRVNGVNEITEIQVGLDGLAIASAKGGITMNLTPKLVYEALAARPYGQPQTAKTWRDVDPSLPDAPILVYGPPATSGTRDALKELVLEAGCKSDPRMAALKESDSDQYTAICTEVRSDGAYNDQGEQDNLIVQKIEGNPRAVGIFGYSYLEENAGKLQGLSMNGVQPTYETISNFSYPGARPLYIYVKNAHLQAIPGLRDYVAAWTQNWGPDGLLAKRGFIAAPDDVRQAQTQVATSFTPMTAEGLK